MNLVLRTSLMVLSLLIGLWITNFDNQKASQEWSKDAARMKNRAVFKSNLERTLGPRGKTIISEVEYSFKDSQWKLTTNSFHYEPGTVYFSKSNKFPSEPMRFLTPHGTIAGMVQKYTSEDWVLITTHKPIVTETNGEWRITFK